MDTQNMHLYLYIEGILPLHYSLVNAQSVYASIGFTFILILVPMFYFLSIYCILCAILFCIGLVPLR